MTGSPAPPRHHHRVVRPAPHRPAPSPTPVGPAGSQAIRRAGRQGDVRSALRPGWRTAGNLGRRGARRGGRPPASARDRSGDRRGRRRLAAPGQAVAPAVLDRQGPPRVGHTRAGRTARRASCRSLAGRATSSARSRPSPDRTCSCPDPPGTAVPGPMSGARTLDSDAGGEPGVIPMPYAGPGCDPAGRSQERRSPPRLRSARCRGLSARTSRAGPPHRCCAFDIRSTSRQRAPGRLTGPYVPDAAGRSAGALAHAPGHRGAEAGAPVPPDDRADPSVPTPKAGWRWKDAALRHDRLRLVLRPRHDGDAGRPARHPRS